MNISNSGIFEEFSNNPFDEKLSEGLVSLFKGNTVIDLGCGCEALYVKYLRQNNVECDGIDGYKNITKNQFCSCFSLEKVLYLSKVYDYVLSLEVGEHIPEEFEDVFINNIHRLNMKGVVISCGIEGQIGEGHVNCKNNDYIKRKFLNLGYKIDLQNEIYLRNLCTLKWLKESLMVFRK